MAQINCNKSPSALTQFLKFCDERNIDIAIISEPPLRNNLPSINKKFNPMYAINSNRPTTNNRRVTRRSSRINQSTSTSQQSNSDQQQPVRACIITFNPALPSIIISHLSNTDYIVANINDIIIASVYCEPNTSINDTLNCITQTVNHANNKKCIIAGDFNAKSLYWGSDTTDDRGQEIMSTIAHLNLNILNEGNKPTFDTVRGQRRILSFIDLSLVNNNIIDHIYDWKVHDNVHLSDHRPITFIITDQYINNQYDRSTTRWNTSNIDWNSWSTDIEQQLDDHNITPAIINNINDHNELDIVVIRITNFIQHACDQHCGKYRNKRTRPAKWTNNQSLKDIINKQKSIYRKIRRCHNPFAIERLKNEYLIARQQYRDLAQSLKDDEFNRYLNGYGPENCYQKVCRLLKNNDNMVARTIEGTYNPIDSTTKLVASLFPDDDFNDNDEQQVIRQHTNKWLSKNKSSNGIPPVSILELNNVVHKFQDGKAPGFDGISPKIVKSFWLFFPDIMLAIYNGCLRLNYVPYLWKSSIIRILPKPGRDDYSKTNAYRPIGLISVLGKVLERIMSIRITNHLTNNGHMSHHQYGFMAGKSTDHALLNLHNDIDTAISKFKHVCLISLDIRGAFDHTWHPFVIDQMIKYRTPKYLIQLINAYQNNRRITVSYGGVTCNKTTNRGTVQGSILGPLMWNLVVNDLLCKNFGFDVNIQAYADDVTMVVACDCINYMSIKINKILEMAACWGRKCKLTFSESKTKIMYVSKRIARPIYSPVRMNGSVIDPVKEIKILGIIFDHKLDYRPHIKHVVSKATRVNKSITGIARKSYGLSPAVLRMIYHSITEPILSYGGIVTNKATTYQHIHKIFRQLVTPIAQQATKAYRTSSFISVTALADFPPIELYINFRATVATARVTGKYLYNDQQIQVDINDNHNDDPSKRIATIIREPSVLPPTRIIIKSIKTARGIGSAYMIFSSTNITRINHFRLPLYCTIQQADLFTISKVFNMIQENHIHHTVYIVTNNISTAQHIGRRDRKNRQRLANELIDMALTNVIVAWNKIDKNEQWYQKLKKYAKRTANNRTREYDYQRMPLSYIKKYEQTKMMINWNTMYHRNRFGTNIKQLCPNVHDARKFVPFINKHVTQTITGHGQFGAYLAKFGISNDKKCCCGFRYQSVQHLINDCQLLNRLRNDYRSTINNTTNPNERTRLTAIFYQNIAIFADEHRLSIHRRHPP